MKSNNLHLPNRSQIYDESHLNSPNAQFAKAAYNDQKFEVKRDPQPPDRPDNLRIEANRLSDQCRDAIAQVEILSIMLFGLNLETKEQCGAGIEISAIPPIAQSVEIANGRMLQLNQLLEKLLRNV